MEFVVPQNKIGSGTFFNDPAVTGRFYTWNFFSHSTDSGDSGIFFSGNNQRVALLVSASATFGYSLHYQTISSETDGIIHRPNGGNVELLFKDVGGFLHGPWYFAHQAGVGGQVLSAISVAYKPPICVPRGRCEPIKVI